MRWVWLISVPPSAFMLLCFSFVITTVQSSSSFVNQQLLDEKNDWVLVGTSTGTFTLPNRDGGVTKFPAEIDKNKCKTNEYPDILGVSYNGNEKTIYATLWLNPVPINKSNFNTQADNIWISGGYQMSVDIPSVYDNGIDYVYRLEWKPQNATWQQTLEERNIGGSKNRVEGVINGSENFDTDRKSLKIFT